MAQPSEAIVVEYGQTPLDDDDDFYDTALSLRQFELRWLR